MYDLLIKGGKVIDPGSGINQICDVAFKDGNIAAVNDHIATELSRSVINAEGKLVTPGLVDIHTHVYWGGTSLGVDACGVCNKSGTTTFVDAGSAGAANFQGFRHFIAEPTPLNVFAFLNIAFAGIFGFTAEDVFGECSDLRLLNPKECLQTAAANADMIVGIKVRVGAEAGGNSGTKPLELARGVADQLGLPIMAHLDMPPPSLKEIMALLQSGDILTHCFRPAPNSVMSDEGIVEDEFLMAKKRGVLFDVGHGMGSFSFAVAEKMIKLGLYPDTISSDIHHWSVNGPAHDVLHTASKFLLLGMPLEQVISRITCAPADAIGKPGLGRLAPGCRGDAVILEEELGEFEFFDALGQKLISECRLRPHTIIVNGKPRNQEICDHHIT